MGRVTQDPTPVTEQPIAGTSAAEVEKPVDISGFEREPEQVTEPVTLQPEPEPASPTIPAVLHSPWLFAILGAAVILLALAAWLLWKRKPAAAPIPSEPESAAPPEVPLPQGISTALIQGIGAREEQQDSWRVSNPAQYAERGLLAVVADGMGGLKNGKAVSELLVRCCQERFHSHLPQADPADQLLDIAFSANDQVNRMLRGQERSGSTLVAALVKNGYLSYLTVGDSHLYLCRGGGLLLLNREHVFSEELALRAVNGSTGMQQVKTDPQSKSLTSYFGLGQLRHLDRCCERVKLIEGDRILLCSDGVFGTLSQEQMEQALQQPGQAAAEALHDMVEAAGRPYQDNYTAVILDYLG